MSQESSLNLMYYTFSHLYIDPTSVLTICYLSFRYLVDSKWFKQWKKYVGYDSWDAYNAGHEESHPGPIDNSGILKGKFQTK